MKKEKRQPVLKLSLCFFLMGLINVCAPNPAFAQNLKQDFLTVVRAKMEDTQNPGLSSKYFSVGDPDKLLAGVDQYVIGVAVDRDYLAHFKTIKYLKSIKWVQHPGLGLTQPRYEDAGWGDIKQFFDGINRSLRAGHDGHMQYQIAKIRELRLCPFKERGITNYDLFVIKELKN
jgi:hypothetical protein